MKLSLSGPALALLSSTLTITPVHVYGTPGTVLGGPFPKGWTTTSDVEDAASLAIDMGYVYEYPTLRQRKEVFETGKTINSELTLSDIGKATSRDRAKDPLRNYYINAFDAIGSYLEGGNDNYNKGYFDGNPAEDYHNTLITDLFDAEATEAPVRGIEKEALLILSIWMEIYHILYTNVYLICRDRKLNDDTGELDIELMHSGLDMAAALWIGHLQVHGDNNRGTMLYNLSERIAIFFNQDHGEAKVNTDFLNRLASMRDEITENADEKCLAESSVDEYETLYRHLTDIVGTMNVPIIQGLIHYITIEADPRLIELYVLVLLPQLRSCNPKYMEYLMDTIGGIRRGAFEGEKGSKLMEAVHLIQSMYSCLGTTCEEVGEHSGGIMCNDCVADQCKDSDDDDVADPIRSFGGYMPEKDVRSYARIDRDVNQISILVEEGNIAAALDLYEGGKNVKVNDRYLSLKFLADFTVFDYVAEELNDTKRIYLFYQNYYEEKNYADLLMIQGFEFASPGSDSELPRAHYLPPLMKALIGPQYAMRAFFAASDLCRNSDTEELDLNQVQEFWDRGAATLVGSIESEDVPGTSEARGMSWYALGYEFCHHFNACDENGDPKANLKMIEHITKGARAIDRADCKLVLRTVRQMESLLLVTIMQGMLYHTAMREKTQSDEHYGAALAFSRAIVPILDIRSRDDAEMIEQSLTKGGQYNGAAQVWRATLLSLDDLGIDCDDLGEDNMLVLSKTETVSFCQHIEVNSNFPTTSHVPTKTPTDYPTRSPASPPVEATSSPTASPTASPTTSPTALPSETNDPAITISSDVLRGYQFTNMDMATMWARISMDLKQMIDLRSHIDFEHSQALGIYRKVTNSDRSIQSIGSNLENRMEDDVLYNIYRHTLRTDSLFNSVGGGSYADEYVSKIIEDAFTADGDVDLAYEGIITLAIWMEVMHLLETAVRECAQETDPGVIRQALTIDQAVAYYVGVGQSFGKTDGNLLYSFAQKSAAESGTIDAVGEASANASIMNHFIEAKTKASQCDGSPGFTKELHEAVGKIMNMMNVPLVQSFYKALEASVESEKPSFYVLLYGLTTLPQVANCQPSEYEYLSDEIISEGGFDVANAEALLRSFRKTYSCYGITSIDVHGNQLDAIKMPNMYAGFAPIDDVRERAIKDREVFVMGTLMAEKATVAAENFFTYGSFIRFPSSSMNYQSLRQVADSTSWLLSEYQFDLTADPNPNFGATTASDLILNAIRGTSIFSQSSTSEREDAVLAGLQSLVLLPSAMGHMGSVGTGQELCTLSNWDVGAAMIVGSIEGAAYGGDERGNGVSMYRLAAELCHSFDVCTTGSKKPPHHAQSNEVLIGYFTNGESMISSDGCLDAETLMKEKVVPNMLGSLIQGIVEYSSTSDLTTRGYMYSKVMFPIVEAINATSSTTLELNARVGSEGSRPALIEAFAYVIKDLNINCEDIGDVFCLEEEKSDTTDLSDGLYITTTFVEHFAKIDLDIEGMTKALDNGNIDLAKDIYTDGLNSDLLNERGRKIGLQSVRNLSLASSSVMDKEPVFNLFRHTFKDVYPFSISVDVHADTFIQKYFKENFLQGIEKKHHTIAAEAAVVLNIWSHVVHKLYETLDSCLNNDFSMDNEGVQMIDEAVAFYIGSMQETGSHLQGYLLYGLAEKASEMFDVELMDGQSRVNRKVLRYLKEAALNLTFNNGCTQPGVVANLGVIIQKIVSQMTVPLIQHLIYFLKTNDRERARLYSHAVVPLLSPCTAETYHYLKKQLITDLPYDSRDINDIIRALQSTYRCIGITCDEVGSPRDVDAPICKMQSELAPLAGYTPTTDVREFSDLDSDIRYIQIMLGESATAAAKYIYQFGRHSTASENALRELLSLRDLATTADRKLAPTYFLIDDYFPSANEADNQVLKYMEGNYSVGTSKDQVEMIVTGTLKYEVLYLAALEKMQSAIIGCRSSDQNRYIRGKEQWDAAAAMIIGPTDNSKTKGDLLYDLADKHCAKFGTCDMKTGEAKSNEELESLFYAGSYLMKTRGCISLEARALQIEVTLLTIFLQATIYSAYENDLLPTGLNEIAYAEGYALSRVVLPYLDSADKPAAATIRENLSFELDHKPVRDGFEVVANSFRKAISKLDNYDVDCKKIGSLDGKDFCLSSYGDKSSANRIGYWSIAVASIATIFLYII